MRNDVLILVVLLCCLTACGQTTKQNIIVEIINMRMENKMLIEIWADIACPFCYIGKRSFEIALSQFVNRDVINVEWKSFQLAPSMPAVPEYQNDIYKLVAYGKGLSYEQSKKMHQDVAQSAKNVGLTFNFDKVLVTNSLKAHRVIQFAKTKGLSEKAEERFLYAYLTQGKNISDVPTLIELGKEIGLAEAEVYEALTTSLYFQKVESETKEAQTLGARGVPFFVINRQYAIAGAQQPNEMLKTLEKAFSDWQKENLNALKIRESQFCESNGDCK